MSDNSKIGWTDATWNPVTGCTKVSPACAYCYIERTPPYRIDGLKFEHGSIPVQLMPERMEIPLTWKRPRRIFVDSLADLFHPDVPDGFIAWVWMTMAKAYWHTFLVLTKRPERMYDFVRRWNDLTGESPDFKGVRGPEETREAHPSGRGQLFAAYLDELLKASGDKVPDGAAWPTFDWMEGPRWWPTRPLHNVQLGITAENQRMIEKRGPWLLATPAAKRWLSIEPLLGPMDLRRVRLYTGEPPHEPDVDLDALTALAIQQDEYPFGRPNRVDWVVVGGESAGPPERRLVERESYAGPNDRTYQRFVPKPEALAWVRQLRDQCVDASTPFFFKQWGGPRPASGGRLLDGREWNEMPA